MSKERPKYPLRSTSDDETAQDKDYGLRHDSLAHAHEVELFRETLNGVVAHLGELHDFLEDLRKEPLANAADIEKFEVFERGLLRRADWLRDMIKKMTVAN